jgi:hypothetical protein
MFEYRKAAKILNVHLFLYLTNHCVMIYYYLGTWEKWFIVIAWQTAIFCLVTPLVASTLSKIVIYNDLFVVIFLMIANR